MTVPLTDGQLILKLMRERQELIETLRSVLPLCVQGNALYARAVAILARLDREAE